MAVGNDFASTAPNGLRRLAWLSVRWAVRLAAPYGFCASLGCADILGIQPGKLEGDSGPDAFAEAPTGPDTVAEAASDSSEVDARASPARGALDVSFGEAGVFATPLFGASAEAALIGPQGLTIQPDGKVVICGDATFEPGSLALTQIQAAILLARLTSDGVLDATFVDGGLTAFNVAPGYPDRTDDVCRTVRLLDDGSIILGGFTLVQQVGQQVGHAFLAVKLTAAGQFDQTFGDEGFVTVLAETDAGLVESKANDLQVAPNGELVLGGFAGAIPPYAPSVLRLSPLDGQLDPSFGNGGRVTLALAPAVAPYEAMSDFEAALVALGPEDDLVVPLTAQAFVATHLSEEGTVDSTYGESGYAVAVPGTTLKPGANAQGAQGIVMQPDGKIVMSGAFDDGRISLARLETNGQPDPTFGQDGTVVTSIPVGEASAGGLVLTQDGGFAVCAGFTLSADAGAPRPVVPGVVRYTSTGALDIGFGNGLGYAALTGLEGNATGEAIAVDAAGRIYLGAVVTNTNVGTASLVVARFWP